MRTRDARRIFFNLIFSIKFCQLFGFEKNYIAVADEAFTSIMLLKEIGIILGQRHSQLCGQAIDNCGFSRGVELSLS